MKKLAILVMGMVAVAFLLPGSVAAKPKKPAISVIGNNLAVVEMTNKATVKNVLNLTATTGGNVQNKNTGGEVKMVTGDAGVNVEIKNQVNTADVVVKQGCGCDGSAVTVLGSCCQSECCEKDCCQTGATISNNNLAVVVVKNEATVWNVVTTTASTGGDEQSKNTSCEGGIVKMSTGDADVLVNITNKVNSATVTVTQ